MRSASGSSVAGMAVDEAFADRIREVLLAEGVTDVVEKRMFGGIAFLVHGNMKAARKAPVTR